MTTGSGDTTHIALASAPTPGPEDQPPTSRRPLIAALVCAGVLCLTLVLVIGGGVAYLVVQRDAQEQMETVPLELEGISTVAPKGWTERKDPTLASMAVVSALRSPDSQQKVTIARDTNGIDDPADLCSVMLDLAKVAGLATVSAEVLSPVTVDGVDAVHQRWVSFSEDQWIQGDTYCMADSAGTLALYTERRSDEEATESPAAEVMLQNWIWRPEAEATDSQG